jgi:tRNA-guanine family transglycosylase
MRQAQGAPGTMTASSTSQKKRFELLGYGEIRLPMIWLGQSVRTTVVTRRYPSFSQECWMVSLGDAVHRPRLAETVFRAGIRERIAVNGPIMLDSGGFTMMMKRRSLPISRIVDIYLQTEAELCITLDLPPVDDDSRAVRSRKYRVTFQNLSHLIERVGDNRIVPVVHGKSEREFDKNCTAISTLIPKPRMICLGGMVPLLRRSGQASERERSETWLRKMIGRVKDQFPNTIVHVLGAGSPKNIATAIRCGADSTDSLAWRRAAGFGTIYLHGTGERFVAHRDRQRANSRPLLSKAEQELIEACSCPACAEFTNVGDRLVELQESYLARAAHNAFVILGRLQGTDR